MPVWDKLGDVTVDTLIKTGIDLKPQELLDVYVLPSSELQIVRTAVSAVFFSLLLAACCQRWSPLRQWLVRMLKPEKDEESNVSSQDDVAFMAGLRIAGAVHNGMVIPLALYCLLYQKELREEPFYAASPLSLLMSSISAGFFVMDAAVTIPNYKSEGMQYVMHATVCAAVYCWAALVQQINFFAAGFLLWELSTPFVHARWFLHQMGMKSTQLYVVNGVTMIVVFTLCRIVFGYWLSWLYLKRAIPYVRDPQEGDIPKPLAWVWMVMVLAMDCLNTYWWFLMVRAALRIFEVIPPKKPATSSPAASDPSSSKQKAS